MSLRGLLTLPVEILPYQEGEPDEYNDAAPEFGDPVEVLGYVERTSNNQDNEDTDDRETASSRLLLVLPAEAEISYKDRVRISGATYEIDGTVNEVWHPRQRRVHHKEANLIFVEG